MATLVSIADGNFTSASSWGVVDTTSLSETSTSNVTVTAAPSWSSSSTFTPGAITISAMAVRLYRRLGTTGTFTCELYNSTDGVTVSDTTVTIDTADFPTDNYLQTTLPISQRGGWIVLKFTAPVTLLAGKAYLIRAQTSTSSQIGLYRNATAGNIDRMLITTTTATPAASDRIVVSGYHSSAGNATTVTITMNETATTVYGAVSCENYGVLTYSTSASNNFYLKSAGDFIVQSNGTFNIGTSGANMPSSSTATLMLNSGSAVQYGLYVQGGGILNVYGYDKTYAYTEIDGDVSAAATTITTSDSTGWLNGDSILVTTTKRAAEAPELRTLNANATGTSLSISSGLTYDHDGGSVVSYIKGHVANLTRNVIITGATSTNTMYVYFYIGAVVNMYWFAYNNFGGNVSAKYGTEILCSNSNIVGGVFYSPGANANITAIRYQQAAAASCTGNLVNKCIMYLPGITSSGGIVGQSAVDETNVFSNCLIAHCGFGVSITNSKFTMTNIIINYTISASAHGVTFSYSLTDGYQFVDYSGFNIYACTASGLALSTRVGNRTFSNLLCWRNGITSGSGLYLTSITNDSNGGVKCKVDISSAKFNGNGRGGIEGNTSCYSYDIIIRDSEAQGTPTYTQPYAMQYSTTTTVVANIYFRNFKMGETYQHTTADYLQGNGESLFTFDNCLFGSTTELATQNRINQASYGVVSRNHNQTANTHKLWKYAGTIQTDSTIYQTVSPSIRLNPIYASVKLETPILKMIGVDAAQVVNVSVAVRESVIGDGVAYNGNRIRLILKANSSLGVDVDTVLATATGASTGAWETLSATLPAADSAGVWELYLDCDGTTGWINIDDWTSDINNDTRSMKYWGAGFPYLGAEYNAGGVSGGSYTFA